MIFNQLAAEMGLCWERDASCMFDCAQKLDGWPIRGSLRVTPKAAAVVGGWDFSDPVTGEFSVDRFWEEKVAWAENGDRTPDGAHCIRVNGIHHVAKPGIVPPRPFLGSAGHRIRWRDSSGKQYESNDVWYQGEIPANFRNRLPDNAEWIPGWWCGGCQEHHVGDQCPKFEWRLNGSNPNMSVECPTCEAPPYRKCKRLPWDAVHFTRAIKAGDEGRRW